LIPSLETFAYRAPAAAIAVMLAQESSLDESNPDETEVDLEPMPDAVQEDLVETEDLATEAEVIEPVPAAPAPVEMTDDIEAEEIKESDGADHASAE